jgi:hypothetical protein
VVGAQGREQPRQLARVSPASLAVRPSQATASSWFPARASAARGWRPAVMSESNWWAAVENPSGSSPSRATGRPSWTSSGPACSNSPRGAASSSWRRAIVTRPRCALHARAHRVPRRGEGHAGARDPAGAQVAKSGAVRAHEEAADNRLATLHECTTPSAAAPGAGERPAPRCARARAGRCGRSSSPRRRGAPAGAPGAPEGRGERAGQRQRPRDAP